MDTKKCFLFISVAIISCQGQLFEDFLPNISNFATRLTDGLTKLPGFQPLVHGAGEILTNTVDVFTQIPFGVSRILGLNGLPTLINNKNVVDLTDSIIADYNIGLKNEDAQLSISQLLYKYGYPVQEHQVVTEDGYVLLMHRIPNNGSVVFLMHGLLGSSDDFIMAGPEKGIAYLLANEGYDVWMGNARGNKHSRKHDHLSPSEGSFWDFSWHEIGIYDLPAMIDYVLKSTQVEEVKYIGHSQGVTSFLVMASEKPEYNRKISVMVALSPVAFMGNVKSPIVRMLSPIGGPIHNILKSLGLHEFLPDNNIVRTLKNLMCGIGPLSDILCGNILFIYCGFGFNHLNASNLPVVFGHTPSGAAVKQFVHYGQGLVSGDFRKFDYGAVDNNRRYGSSVPPSYMLENIKAPVSLFYSDTDWLAHAADVKLLYSRLGNVIDVYKIPSVEFNHLDFIIANDIDVIIFRRLREIFEKF